MRGKASVRINRQDKNNMRDQLEEILDIHQQVNRKVEVYRKQNQVADYQGFWDELRQRNHETIQVLSRYMVMKCNR